MISNYLKIAWRIVVRNKAFSFINIFGLALGMTGSLLILLWVQDELSVDAFNGDKEIYGVYEKQFSEGKVEGGYYSPGMLADELKRTVPQIQYAAAFWQQHPLLFSAGEKKERIMGAYAGSDFLKIFNYRLILGKAASALARPADIAISRNMAMTFFGSPEAAMGKTIRFNNADDFMVSAVFENVPSNSSAQFDYLINWEYVLNTATWLRYWIYGVPKTFITLRPGSDPSLVEANIKNFITPYLSGQEGDGYHFELGLQRFDKMYLNNHFKNGEPDGGRIEYVRLFSLVAVFILLIACINFMNLATARSVKRAQEVGIRKTVGAIRWRLIVQFIGEAVLLSFFAIIGALTLVLVSLPFFNELTGKQIVLPYMMPSFWGMIAVLAFLTGAIAGSYPALFLSSLHPVTVLKGALKFSPWALLFRKSLVVFQFVLSIVLITATIIVARQIKFLQTKNLGFDRENLVYVPLEDDLQPNYSAFKQELSSLTGIKSVTRSTSLLTQTNAAVHDLDWDGKPANLRVLPKFITVGYDFFKTVGLTLLQGRDFSPAYPEDTVGYIVNETALKMIGYTNPIDRPLTFFGHRGRIIGVVKDFNFKSLHEPIEPLIFQFREAVDWGGYVMIRTEAGKTQQALTGIERVYKRYSPVYPFSYQFSDEEYQKLYMSELTVSKLSNRFSFLAIFLSCLGLLGLTMFTAEQRKKEIGIRKVIGASVSDIVAMLSKDIVILIGIATLIAIPIAWLTMHSWLQNFAYRISISWWIFLVASMAVLLIALFTISYQSIRSALANPVNSLRSE